jgi:hypothetical protein
MPSQQLDSLIKVVQDFPTTFGSGFTISQALNMFLEDDSLGKSGRSVSLIKRYLRDPRLVHFPYVSWLLIECSLSTAS